MAVKVRQTGGDNRLGDGCATVTAHWLALTVDHRGVGNARRNRQTTVEADSFSNESVVVQADSPVK